MRAPTTVRQAVLQHVPNDQSRRRNVIKLHFPYHPVSFLLSHHVLMDWCSFWCDALGRVWACKLLRLPHRFRVMLSLRHVWRLPRAADGLMSRHTLIRDRRHIAYWAHVDQVPGPDRVALPVFCILDSLPSDGVRGSRLLIPRRLGHYSPAARYICDPARLSL